MVLLSPTKHILLATNISCSHQQGKNVCAKSYHCKHKVRIHPTNEGTELSSVEVDMVSPFRELPVWWRLEQRHVREGSPPSVRDKKEANGR